MTLRSVQDKSTRTLSPFSEDELSHLPRDQAALLSAPMSHYQLVLASTPGRIDYIWHDDDGVLVMLPLQGRPLTPDLCELYLIEKIIGKILKENVSDRSICCESVG